MDDKNSRSPPALQNNGVVDFSLRSPRLEEIDEFTNKFITSGRLNPPYRARNADGRLSIHGTRNFGIFTVAYGTELTVQLHPTDVSDRLAIVMAERGVGQARMEGQDYAFASEQGVVFKSGQKASLYYQSDCETLTLWLSSSSLAEQCAKLLGHELERPMEFDRQMSLAGPSGQSWQRLVRYAAEEWSQPLSMTRQLPAVAQQLEQTVTTAFLLGHAHAYSDALLRPQSAVAPFYVKRAEAYIEAHFSEPLSLAEIAAHVGVSARSLQNGFQAYRNTTPMAFLRSIRLQRVHRALLAADPAVARITDIALACGFNHMGEFATAYRRAFCEAPRQTLARAR